MHELYVCAFMQGSSIRYQIKHHVVEQPPISHAIAKRKIKVEKKEQAFSRRKKEILKGFLKDQQRGFDMQADMVKTRSKLAKIVSGTTQRKKKRSEEYSSGYSRSRSQSATRMLQLENDEPRKPVQLEKRKGAERLRSSSPRSRRSPPQATPDSPNFTRIQRERQRNERRRSRSTSPNFTRVPPPTSPERGRQRTEGRRSPRRSTGDERKGWAPQREGTQTT